MDFETKEPGVLVLGVHGGKFHLDDAMSCFLMSSLYGARCGNKVRVHRSSVSDGSDLTDCDIIMDVGMIYDHSKRRYDHHQRDYMEVYDDKMTEKNGRPLKMASVGLIWRHYGDAIVRAMWPSPKNGQEHCIEKPSDADVALVVKRLYSSLFAMIDADDNGLELFQSTDFAEGRQPRPLYRDSTGLSRRVELLNVRWNEPLAPGRADEQFAKAMEVAGADFMIIFEDIATSWLPARQMVAQAYFDRKKFRANGHVLVNEVGGFPYKDHLRELEAEHCRSTAEHPEPAVLYVVSWDRGRKQWSAVAVEVRPGSFENKLPFPVEWRGLRDEELCAASGIPHCVFVHSSGFLACNTDREDLLAMIDKSIEMQPERYAQYKGPAA